MEVATDRLKASTPRRAPRSAAARRARPGHGAFVGNRRARWRGSAPSRPCARTPAAVKAHLLDHLDVYLERLVDALEASACRALRRRRRRGARVESSRAEGPRTVVKSKSMVTEEIGLNEALAAGRRDADRDRPRRVHPAARRRRPQPHRRPALHWTRERVAALFHDRLGTPLDADPRR
jgi:L-lactate dehydrogenase complex protein LldF